MNVVYTESLPILPYDKAEILRYSGVRVSDSNIDKLFDDCIKELEGKIQSRVCFCEFDIVRIENGVDLGFAKVKSSLLEKHLKGCHKIVLFAATIGVEIDRLIAKYSKLSPSKALMLQAIGTERIETFCNQFEESINFKNGGNTTSRVSAGYGDIPLALQKDIFAVLDCPRKIGVSLNESLLMSPTKSVTAIIGIGTAECIENGCERCNITDCGFRRKK